MAPTRAVVIGAGLGGLAAACHLAGGGADVTLVEEGDRPGGLTGLLVRDGYRLDTGPTVLTMPELLEPAFAAVGADVTACLKLERLDPIYRACFADGSTLRVRAERGAMAEEIRAQCGATEAAAFERFRDWLTTLYQVEFPAFIDRNFDSPLELLRPVGPLMALVRLGGLRRLSTMVERTFRDERLRRLFSFQALYVGLAPQRALAAMAIVTYMDSVAGVWFPAGGIHAIPEALAAAATNAGVDIRYRTRADRILTAGSARGAVRGVALETGEQLAADAVVCNADRDSVYGQLLADLPPARMVRRARYSPSALLLLAGVRGSAPPDAAHHNLHFGDAWKSAFRTLITDGRRMPDPSFLVSLPASTDPSLAPAGRSIVHALEPVPNLDGRVDWAADSARSRAELLARVRDAGYLPEEPEVAEWTDPPAWAARGLTRGTPFSLAHSFWQSGPFRPPNRERRVPGLFFCGAGTVPGVGVPMVLISGRLAAARVLEARG